MQTSLIQCIECICEILLLITNFIYLQHCASEWLESSLEMKCQTQRSCHHDYIHTFYVGKTSEAVFSCWLLYIQASKVVVTKMRVK